MEKLMALIMKHSPQKLQSTSESTYEEYIQNEVNHFNAQHGDLTELNCELCKNKGYVAIVSEGGKRIVPCRCLEARASMKRLRSSGINERYALETFKVTQPWQGKLLQAANDFLKHPSGWLFVGGQVGAGKTHICTGIVRKLIESGRAARYMCWRDDSTIIKASIKNPDEYAALVQPLKTVDVLYIDDFFKSFGTPTPADVNLAFEILNARYNNDKLITIISSEFYLTQLVELDQAVGSRVYEKSNKSALIIDRDIKKNYRLRGAR